MAGQTADLIRVTKLSRDQAGVMAEPAEFAYFPPHGGNMRLGSFSLVAVLVFGLSQPARAQSSGKADLIVAVDTSASMESEVNEFRGMLNAIARNLTAAGVDFRVVLIADPAA